MTLSSPVRKNNNAIIPFEFRNDTSDGGIERAALATVFGVKEYTESKIFWNADEESILDKPVLLQRGSSKKSYTTAPNVSRMFNKEKALPIIPVVSEFGDIWSETNLEKRSIEQLQQGLPADLSDYPLALFDLIGSDQNTNIILWATQQQPSSHNEEEAYPSSVNGKKKKLRWTTHQFSIPESLKLKKKTSSTFSMCSPIQETRMIEAATIEKLIEKLTISLDYTFMTDFFLIFRVFMTPLQLCKFLILRFKWSIENNDEKRCIVRIRTFVVMRHWLLNYFLHDFVPSRELRITLTSFLNVMPSHPLIKQSPRDQRIIKGLKRVVRRLKKLYYASTSPSRVQVIVPPPPTDEQEKIQAMAREKISQNTIRQKTLNRVNGIHIDVRHGDNTAIKNKHVAPVVVIGTSNTNKTEKLSRRRRRGSSTSSGITPNIKVPTSNHSLPTSLYTLPDDLNGSATMEWDNLKQQKENGHRSSHSQGFDFSNISDSSLESIISPGTSAEVSEDDDDDDEEEEEEEEEDDLYNASFHSKTIPEPVPHAVSDELAAKLERLRKQQQQEADEVDEKTEAEIFLAAYSANPAATTAAIVHKTQPTFDDSLRMRSYYHAQLAVPSTMSTPDIHHSQQHYFERTSNHDTNDRMINSASFNSMAYPSATESEVVTPSIEPVMEKGRTGLSDSFKQDSPKLSPLFPVHHCQNKRIGKPLIDPRIKPLPIPVIENETRAINNKKEEEGRNVEEWRVSVYQSSSLKAPEETHYSSRHNESNSTENTINTPKSRIIELDLDLQNHLLSKLPPPLPIPTQCQQKSIVLSYSTSLMAQQFCLIEKDVLLSIDWEELVDCKWTKMAASSCYHPQSNSDSIPDEDTSRQLSIPTSATADPVQGIYSRTKRRKQQYERNNDGTERGIEKAINRFNAVCQWVSSEIVKTKQLDQRVKLIEKFIRLAKKCKLYFNFTTLLQILLGLQSSSVSRLSKTWPLVNRREMKTLQELSAFTSPTKNWKNIRDSMSQVAEEFGESPTEVQVEVDTTNHTKKKGSVTIKLPFGGCIPFLGIYLSDLVFNAELPSYLPSNNNKKLHGMADAVLSQPLVHFRKHRITATVIKRVLVFQNLARRYAFEESADAGLYSSCFQVVSLDTDTIQKMSYEIEPLFSN